MPLAPSALREISDILRNASARSPTGRHIRRIAPPLMHRALNQPRVSDELEAKIDFTLASSWAMKTQQKYSSGVESFIVFCIREGISQEFAFPATEYTLTAFVADEAAKWGGGTIKSHITAIRAQHKVLNLPWNGGARLAQVLKGAEKLTPESSRRPLRPPISAGMLAELHNGLNLANYLDAAVDSAAMTLLWSQSRMGEALPTSATRYDPSLHPLCSDMHSTNTSTGSVIIHWPNTKVCGKQGEDVYVCRQADCTDPVSTLQNAHRVNGLTAGLPLFAYKVLDGHRALTQSKFLQRCNEIWQPLGYPRITGHSFRIGGTTELLLRGVPPEIVKVCGRWSSDVFYRYWRSLEIIAPLYIEFLPPAPKGRSALDASIPPSFR